MRSIFVAVAAAVGCGIALSAAAWAQTPGGPENGTAKEMVSGQETDVPVPFSQPEAAAPDQASSQISSAQETAAGGKTGYTQHGAFRKATRGISNILVGWMEIPSTIGRQMKKGEGNDEAQHLVSGIILGIRNAFVRTGVGVFELLTFPLPIPDGYVPILPTLDYVDSGNKERLLLE